MVRHVLELFAQGTAGTIDTHMFSVASLQDVINLRGSSAISVTMLDERRRHVLIN